LANKKEADAIKELKKDERFKQAYALEQKWLALEQRRGLHWNKRGLQLRQKVLRWRAKN
jgi:hypothetical protein